MGRAEPRADQVTIARRTVNLYPWWDEPGGTRISLSFGNGVAPAEKA